MKSIFSTALLATILVANVNAFADDSKRVTSLADISIGDGGAILGVGPAIKVLPGVKVVGQVEGGIDIQKYNKDGLIGGSTERAMSPSIGATAGVILSLDIFHLKPLIKYKCESANSNLREEQKSAYGCGTRAGANFMIGDENGSQIGVDWSRSITDVNHGEEDEFNLMIRIPFASNDEGRNVKSKNDMDFDRSERPAKKDVKSGAMNA